MIPASSYSTIPRRVSGSCRVCLSVVVLMLVGVGCSAPATESATPTNPALPSTQPVAEQAPPTAAAASEEQTGNAPDNAEVVVGDRLSASAFAVEVAELTETMFYANNTSLVETFNQVFHRDSSQPLIDQVVQELAPVRSALAEAPTTQRTWFAVRALSSEVTSLDETAGTASVEVWVTQVFSRRDISEPTASYETHTFNLKWTQDGWRVTAWSTLPGPTARLSISEFPSTAVELDRLLDGHRLLHDKSVS